MEKIIRDPKPTSIAPKDYPTGITGELVDYEAQIYSTSGELLLAYYKAPKDIHGLALMVAKGTSPVRSSRTSGVPQLSTVYGPLPRLGIREDYCRFSRQTKSEKPNAERAYYLNEKIAKFYKRKHPELYAKALLSTSNAVISDYRLKETPWTNININLNQVIKYHRDKGNNPDDFSNVLIVKQGVSGGGLSCPGLGITLHQGDGWLVFFKGQEVLHGVTPCNFANSNSFRCSIVNYTLSNLKHCYPYEEELKRLKGVKTKQAINRRANLGKLAKYLERQKIKQNKS